MSQSPWHVPNSDKNSKRERIRLQLQEQREQRESYESQPKIIRLIVFLLGMALLLFGLSLAFPISSAFDPYLVRSLIIITIFGGAAAFWSRASLYKIMKVAGLWLAIIASISIFYLYRSDLGDRFMSSIDPSGVITTDDGLMVHRAKDGHFWVRTRINGALMNLMVDTGASNIVLSPEDAKKAGFTPNVLSFNEFAETANGRVPFARATATSLVLGSTTLFDVPITVNGAEMQGSLMGMSVLKRFTSVEFRGDTLILRQ